MYRCSLLLALAALVSVPVLGQPLVADAQVTSSALSRGLAFVENRGQWPDEVLFRARLGGGTAWVTRDGVTFDFYAVERAERDADDPRHDEPEARRRQGHVVQMHFEGGHARRAVGHGRREAYHNYFLGNEPSRWASRVPLYDEVVLEGLYDGIDLRLYEDGGRLRYDLAVAPGADAGQIRIRLEGAEAVSVTAAGALSVRTALGPVEHRGLVAYQEGAGGRRETVASAFRVGADGAVSFAVAGADPARRLVIDPLIWATFLGGEYEDPAYGVAAGDDGSATVVGWTRSSDFPTTPGAYDTSLDNVTDAFVTRLSADGTSLLYSTFLGGAAFPPFCDEAGAVAVGADGSATVVGLTCSSDFPVTPDAFDTSHNSGSDAFVTRLSADGASLLYSTFLGGTGGEQALGVALGTDGGAVVTGHTGSTDFPVTPGAYDTSYNGGDNFGGDVFIARLSADGSALAFATYLGGLSADQPGGVGLGPDGSVTVAGWTREEEDFPVTPGAFDTTYNGGHYDAFVARLSADGSSLLYGTYLGGEVNDFASSVSVGPDGNATVAGHTGGAGFPVTPGAYDTTGNDTFSLDGFVTRFSTDGSSLVYSTYLGGTYTDRLRGLALGADGSATVVGETRSADFPTTPGAFDTSYNSNTDAFVTRLSSDGSSLLYSTFLGWRGSEIAYAVALPTDESAIVAGDAQEGFPVTPGSFDTTYNGGYADAFVAHLSVELPSFVLTAEALNSPAARGDTLLVRAVLVNNTPEPFSGDLLLEVESQYGLTATRVLARNRTLAPGETATPTFALHVPPLAPLGFYAATVTALEGGTTPLGDATFAFRVVEEAARGLEGASQEEAARRPWAGELLDGGGLAAEAAPAPDTQGSAASGVVAPNPASDGAVLAFTLAEPASVRLSLHDVLGREVSALGAGPLEAGPHRLALDLSALPAGTYLWRLVAGEQTQTGRLTVAR